MKTSIPDLPHACDDLQALRRAIAQLADRCGINLLDGAALRRLLDDDFSDCRGGRRDLQYAQDLSAMLTLLFRLEASSSEDLGISGLRRLWRAHGTILAHFRAGLAAEGAGQAPVAAF